MDILGKQGEEASKHVRQVAEKTEQLEQHLDAVDNALQDFTDNYSRIMEEEMQWQEEQILRMREVLDVSEDETDRIEKMENRLDDLENRFTTVETDLEEFLGSGLESSLKDLVKEVKQTRGFMQETRKQLKNLEERVDAVEGDMMVEVNNRDYDFEQKVDEKEFKSTEKEMRQEIRNLRASVNILAQELDKKDEIEIE